MSSQTFRVRFTEWQAFGRDIPADTAEDAIDIARTLREGRGTIDFEELDGGTENWEAEVSERSPEPNVAALRGAIQLALRALNTAKRFRVGNTNSYAIASRLQDALRETEGGAG